jgi:hypothetical protein
VVVGFINEKKLLFHTKKNTMRVILLVALLAVFAFAVGKTAEQKPKKLSQFDPKVFAKCLADKLGITLDKAVGCALSCKLDLDCYPTCLGVADKKKVIVAAVECALSSKKSSENKTLGKLMNKKVSEKKETEEKKKIKSIFTRLLNKAQKEAKYQKLPVKDQVKIAKGKIAQRITILKNILKKVTVADKKDDAEKKTLKKLIREFAARNLLKVAVQKKLLKKACTKGKKGSKKPTKKATKKNDAVKKALADAEFLGKFGKFLGKTLKTVGKAALQGAKDGAIGALTGALA